MPKQIVSAMAGLISGIIGVCIILPYIFYSVFSFFYQPLKRLSLLARIILAPFILSVTLLGSGIAACALPLICSLAGFYHGAFIGIGFMFAVFNWLRNRNDWYNTHDQRVNGPETDYELANTLLLSYLEDLQKKPSSSTYLPLTSNEMEKYEKISPTKKNKPDQDAFLTLCPISLEPVLTLATPFTLTLKTCKKTSYVIYDAENLLAWVRQCTRQRKLATDPITRQDLTQDVKAFFKGLPNDKITALNNIRTIINNDQLAAAFTQKQKAFSLFRANFLADTSIGKSDEANSHVNCPLQKSS